MTKPEGRQARGIQASALAVRALPSRPARTLPQPQTRTELLTWRQAHADSSVDVFSARALPHAGF